MLILGTCCNAAELGYLVPAPPSCFAVAAGGDAADCELAMLALQDSDGPLLPSPGPGGCAADSANNPLLPESNPACEALDFCCSSIQNTTDSALCSFVQSLHFSDRCDATLAYLEWVRLFCGVTNPQRSRSLESSQARLQRGKRLRNDRAYVA
jgi:hypothetical protein